MTTENNQTEYQDNIPKEIAELQDAISRHNTQKVKLLLTNEILDEVQKGHLIEFAKAKGNATIVQMIEQTPATP
ncbi:hypothetical protein [Alteromonas ponticola]|uniref:Uncharacterized protein n=1 Tax=Alteromonas ponticola TaxID=2720613 RepID=A0ABX1R105_9ALTE|nr:hypothetical protein [Alteromonas ponticola]NMH60150.1 hypothetical protein [Alteromonas ponticola]